MTTTFIRGEDPLRADKLNTAFSERVAKTGDTLTGPLVAAGDPTTALGLATKQYVDNKVATEPAPLRRVVYGSGTINVTGGIGNSTTTVLFPFEATATYIIFSVVLASEDADDNFTVELYDGTPTTHLLYQASGVTGTDFADRIPFYIDTLVGAAMNVKIINNTLIALAVEIDIAYTEVLP